MGGTDQWLAAVLRPIETIASAAELVAGGAHNAINTILALQG